MHDTKRNTTLRQAGGRIIAAFALPAMAALCAMAVGLASPGAAHAGEPDIIGRWMTKDHDGVFEISQCGQQVCGRLAGLRYTTDMPPTRKRRGTGMAMLPIRTPAMCTMPSCGSRNRAT